MRLRYRRDGYVEGQRELSFSKKAVKILHSDFGMTDFIADERNRVVIRTSSSEFTSVNTESKNILRHNRKNIRAKRM